ncbi:MAG: nitroreductase family protein [Clostridia bacterium]|nr:nitroreductase family protein [Clostridia bacterium]
MQTLENLYSRRTIRTYNGKNLTDKELKEILKSAYAAPIGLKRYDSLALTVITNAEYIAKWEQEVYKAMGREHPFYGAPMVILVSSIIQDPPHDNVNYSNAAGIVENMAIAATELGIGACHIWGAVRTLNDLPELKAELNIPEGMIPCCALALGHTDEEYYLREIEEGKIATNFIK